MKIGFIGLGKMGANMVRRLLLDKQEIVAFDFSADAVAQVAEHGAIPASSLANVVEQLKGEARKAVWLMVPAGKPVDESIAQLEQLLSPGDIIIDGGNSFWKHTVKRSESLAAKGISFVDCGTSGGVWGLQNGYCLMSGGEQTAVEYLKPIFTGLACAGGYLHCGRSGAGHFTKMVHNGIEYGMMQSIAEGYEIMQKTDFDLDLQKISELWMHGSVVRSWLVELVGLALKEDPELDNIRGYVADNGEARWTIETAIDLDVPVHAIAASLFTRFESRQDESFAMKMLAAMRNQFGGHAVKSK